MRSLRCCALAALLGGAALGVGPAWAQKVKSAPFSYLPEQGEDRYNMRVPRKTLPLPDGSGFVILAHQSGSAYAVERYDAELKKLWSTTLAVAPGETVEAFGRSAQQVWVVLHQPAEAEQRLAVQPVNVQTGQRGAPKVLVTAPPRDRRPGVALSPDGSHLLAYRYQARAEQVRALDATLYDQNLAPVLTRSYDFRAFGAFFSPSVLLGNDGTQYVTLVSDGMKKLSVRRYPPTPDQRAAATPVPVLGVPVGGTFGGRPVTVRDAKFSLLPDGRLYAAALCADYNTGEYTSLKVVRFDFDANDLKFAPEFTFTPEYLKEITAATGAEAKRLDDVYLSDLLLTDGKNLVVVAEKHYEEGGPTLPVHARELHLFGYNEYSAPTWHRILAKDQVATAVDAYTGIGYRAAVFGETVQLLALETLGGKSDLYLHRLNAQTGAVAEPERLKLNVANDQKELAYVKDFTAWLGPKTIVGVSRPSKKSAALQLNRVGLK